MSWLWSPHPHTHIHTGRFCCSGYWKLCELSVKEELGWNLRSRGLSGAPRSDWGQPWSSHLPWPDLWWDRASYTCGTGVLQSGDQHPLPSAWKPSKLSELSTAPYIYSECASERKGRCWSLACVLHWKEVRIHFLTLPTISMSSWRTKDIWGFFPQ